MPPQAVNNCYPSCVTTKDNFLTPYLHTLRHINHAITFVLHIVETLDFSTGVSVVPSTESMFVVLTTLKSMVSP